MDAWTVYWLFQLDTIRGFLGSVSAISTIPILVIWLFSAVCFDTRNYDESTADYSKRSESITAKFKPYRLLTIPWIIFMFIAVLLPSTKTMAAIIVLPKIASAENLEMVAKDGGEIYKLAMERIKDTLGSTPKE